MRSFKSAWKDRRRRRLLESAGHRAVDGSGLWSAGERSGTWTIDPERLHANSVVYSFGIGDNTAFEVALARRFQLHVFAFDPTPRALEHARLQSFDEAIEVIPVGLADFDGEQSFESPRGRKSVNFRPVPRGRGGERTEASFPVRTLATLMKDRGHSWLDLLKMDIEGGEVPVLEALFEVGGPPADQVLIEFHHRPDGRDFAATDRLLRAFYAHDFELIHVSHRGLEMSLRKTRERMLV